MADAYLPECSGDDEPRLVGDLIGIEVDGEEVLLDAVLSNANTGDCDPDTPPGTPVTLVLAVPPGEGERLEQALRPLVDEGLIWELPRHDALDHATLVVAAADHPNTVIVTI